MCNQTGQEIDWEKCPPDWEDFPQIVVDAINIFHSKIIVTMLTTEITIPTSIPINSFNLTSS